MKKSIIALLSICMAACLFSACATTPTTSTPPTSPSTGSESTGGSDSTGSGSTVTPELPDEDPILTILEEAYALASGASLSGTHTLTGVVSSIVRTSQGDVCLTFIVGNYAQYPMYCYWLQDASSVKVGDTITVQGTIKNYNGTIEFDHPVLVNGDTGENGGDTGSTSYTYTDFTSTEKALFTQYFGEVIPFAPNNDYYVEEYSQTYDDGQVETGLNFYTFGNTQADFDAYRAAFSAYESAGTDKDEYGDTWYFYNGDGYYVDMAYYYDSDEDGYWLDVYAYTLTTGDTSGGNTGGSTGGSGDTTGGNTQQPDTLMTNAGKGLPTGENGVYDVDFTKATYVKDVTDQGYYLDGCPTLSTANANPAVLVVPVQFSDVTANSKSYTIDNIRKAWMGTPAEVSYYSVRDYYYTSSYGKLDLNVTVLNEWFTPKNPSSYYLNATMDYDGSTIECGDQMIIDEILAYYDSSINFSQFDSDNNGTIDSIVLINTLDINSDVTMQWAYRYWNLYTDDQGYYYEYDGVSANDYLWASYAFMHETYDENGNTSYNTSIINTYTFIHEFGHVLGADDYYDTSYSTEQGPMSGCDIMDSMTGDHNAYTKFNYGWLTSSRLVVAEESVTLSLEDFSKNGDTIIIANNWDEALGLYQEYYILAYYKNAGLNGGDEAGYFSRDGIVVYHVNASLYSEVYDGETYYDVYNNNTAASDEYGTQDNLIEYVKSSAGNFTYVVGDGISADTTDDQGNKIAYTFTVDELTDTTATITFTKNN